MFPISNCYHVTAMTKSDQCNVQVDFFKFILHDKLGGGKELHCPYCHASGKIGILEGKGYNDGLRTVHCSDGSVGKAYYSRFMCTSPTCPGNPYDKRRKRGKSNSLNTTGSIAYGSSFLWI